MHGQQPARRRRRLGVARFWYEGNAFSPLPADMEAFERCEWTSGDGALEGARGTATELGAVAAFAATHPDWDVVVLRCAAALPAGPIDEAVFGRFMRDLDAGIDRGLETGGWDAFYLSLHGAAITAARRTPDLDIVRLARERMPQVPIGASFDLHANMSPDIAPLVDFASVYRTHPHLDMADTATRVLDGLLRCAELDLCTRRAFAHTGLLLPSFNMRTSAGPMKALEDVARALASGPVLEVGVFGGFPYADTECAGASVLALSDARLDRDGGAAQRAAARVADEIARRAPEFDVRLPGPEAAIAAAVQSPKAGLIAVTDPADNPLSGGACDTPGLLRALLAAHVDAPCVFASFADPRTVATAVNAGLGAAVDVTLGARHGAQFGESVRLRARVRLVTGGVFRNTGPMATGVERDCGTSVVLEVVEQPAIRIVVTTQVMAADDPAFYDLHQIDSRSLRLLCVKAKNHFRAGMGARCAEIIDCDAPGPACLDLSKLPFRHAAHRRPAPRAVRRA